MHRTHAVYRRVMYLLIERELAVLQALDQVCLPQGTIAIKQYAVQPRGQCEQLAVASGFGQGGVADVIVQIDVLVLFPEEAQR